MKTRPATRTKRPGPLRNATGKRTPSMVAAAGITARKRTEEALRESEECLQLATDAAGFGIYTYDFVSGTGYWSPELKAILGLKPDEPVHLDADQLFVGLHPDDRKAFLAAMLAANDPSGSGLFRHDYRVIHPGGAVRRLHVRGRTSFAGKGSAGRAVRAAGVVLDITARKPAAEELRASRQFAQATIDAISAQICVLDGAGTIIAVNRCWREFATANELTPQYAAEGVNYLAICDAITGPDAEMAATFAAGIRAVMNDERDSFSLEYPCHSPAEQRWFVGRVTRFPRHGDTRVVVAHENITERKQTEGALREREAGLAAAQRIAHIGSWRWNVQNNTARWSDETFRIFGIAPGQLEDHRKSFVGLVHPADRERVDQALADALSGTRDYDLDYRLRLPDGIEKVIHAHAEVVTGRDGQPVMMQGTVHDITERRQAEAELRELSGRLLRLEDDERQRLARELHDTTAQELAAISMNLAVLKARAPELKAGAQAILAETAALTDHCASGIRTMSYLLHPPALDALGLAGAGRDYADGFARRSGIRVDLKISDDLGRLPAEIERALFRVLQESLANIHRHSGSRTASICLTRTTGQIRLEVRDTGRGMNIAAGLPAGGLGVGIPGMRERMRQFWGQLKIESDAQGTCIIAIVPLDPKTNQP